MSSDYYACRFEMETNRHEFNVKLPQTHSRTVVLQYPGVPRTIAPTPTNRRQIDLLALSTMASDPGPFRGLSCNRYNVAVQMEWVREYEYCPGAHGARKSGKALPFALFTTFTPGWLVVLRRSCCHRTRSNDPNRAINHNCATVAHRLQDGWCNGGPVQHYCTTDRH